MAVEAMPQMQHQNRTLEKMEVFSFAATFSAVRSSFFSSETLSLLLRNGSNISVGGGLKESYTSMDPFVHHPIPVD
jgi:hypothetical protein